MDFYCFETPLGFMALASEEDAITRVYLPGTPTPRLATRETPLLARGRDQLLEYMAGKRRSFDLPLDPQGTPFQQKVWSALRDIPWGETRTYGAIAWAIDSPRSARAVGMACRQNPLPILIPCHRIIGGDGSLGGYAGGTELKQALLTLEGYEKK